MSFEISKRLCHNVFLRTLSSHCFIKYSRRIDMKLWWDWIRNKQSQGIWWLSSSHTRNVRHFSKAPESTIFSRSRWNLVRGKTWFILVYNSKAQTRLLHTKLACTKCLTSGKKNKKLKIDNFQSAPESTVFNCSRWNLESFIPHSRAQTTLCQGDGQTDTLSPISLHYTGDN